MPGKNIAWGITGAGAFLKESINAISKIMDNGVGVTAYVSRAGRNVLAMYGYLDQLTGILQGPYPIGVVFEDEEDAGYPSTGRIYRGVYNLVVVSPASMNTVSKIVNGIADSLVSNLVMHAVKNNIPVLIMPVDLYESKSVIPLVIDRDKCSMCGKCIVAENCPTGALRPDPRHKVRVSPAKCTRCFICRKICPYNAIHFDVEVVVKPHSFYVGIIKRLNDIGGVEIIDHPDRVLEYI
ncbi:flavoprotein [Desulfurococcus sp.]|jgi:dihydromethanopterin reductase (acceptor)|uniref:flavoprotein n=1 Tax=Desulfurococcus sp. TaxID=51678 RepID=UPI0031793085